VSLCGGDCWWVWQAERACPCFELTHRWCLRPATGRICPWRIPRTGQGNRCPPAAAQVVGAGCRARYMPGKSQVNQGTAASVWSPNLPARSLAALSAIWPDHAHWGVAFAGVCYDVGGAAVGACRFAVPYRESVARRDPARGACGWFVRCSVHGCSAGCKSLGWRDRSVERSGGAGVVQYPGLGGCRRVTNRETRGRCGRMAAG
jgi:hypothetical protein